MLIINLKELIEGYKSVITSSKRRKFILKETWCKCTALRNRNNGRVDGWFRTNCNTSSFHPKSNYKQNNLKFCNIFESALLTESKADTKTKFLRSQSTSAPHQQKMKINRGAAPWARDHCLFLRPHADIPGFRGVWRLGYFHFRINEEEILVLHKLSQNFCPRNRRLLSRLLFKFSAFLFAAYLLT